MRGAPRDPVSKMLARGEAVRRFGPGRSFRLVFTNGCFDVLHPGHVQYLMHARGLGDALVVGVNTDESVRRLEKGPNRPVVHQDARALVLCGLESVDAVTLFDEDTPEALVRELEPDVLVKGGDYAARSMAGGDAVRSWGGEVVTVPLVEGYSTTAVLERIRSAMSDVSEARS